MIQCFKGIASHHKICMVERSDSDINWTDQNHSPGETLEESSEGSVDPYKLPNYFYELFFRSINTEIHFLVSSIIFFPIFVPP